MTKFDEFGLPEPTKYPQMPKVIKMNEQIQELAYETKLLTGALPGTPEWQKIFAELIIRKCAEKIAHNQKFNWLDAAQAAKDLKQHFGVE